MMVVLGVLLIVVILTSVILSAYAGALEGLPILVNGSVRRSRASPTTES